MQITFDSRDFHDKMIEYFLVSVMMIATIYMERLNGNNSMSVARQKDLR